MDMAVLVEAQGVDPEAGRLVELLVAVRRAAPVGWLLTIGAGGALVELLRDTQNLLLPVTDDAIRVALQALAVGQLLDGHRGSPGVDLDALVVVIQQIAELATVVAGVVELEVNPVLVGPGGATVVDALIEIEIYGEEQ